MVPTRMDGSEHRLDRIGKVREFFGVIVVMEGDAEVEKRIDFEDAGGTTNSGDLQFMSGKKRVDPVSLTRAAGRDNPDRIALGEVGTKS